MAKTETIIEELERVTGLNESETEARSVFLRRLMKGGAALSDDDWDHVTEPTQKWVNECVEQLNAKMPLTDPATNKAVVDAEATTEKKPVAAKVKEPTKAKAKEPVKAAVAKPAVKVKPAAKPKPKPYPRPRAATAQKAKVVAKTKVTLTAGSNNSQLNAPAVMRELMVKKPNITHVEVVAVFEKKKLVAPTLSTYRGYHREVNHVLRILQEAGRLK